ncbi:protein YacC [Edwardsiella piscicida]|uniref:Chaperone lipoprotein YacC, potentially involved in protein secretion n=2 Tax=Edwardsiella anguillarum TaxID=1821960 RepID=A0A076LLW7_9GAMM|nr:Hypothetical protein ETEE_2435 [Edwardsiella anguillarum ET080813]GAJ66831.1 protein YacC [Edwardsiella piscicida]
MFSGMKKSSLLVLLLGLLSITTSSRALDEMQAEDLADLTAIFVYLKNDCGYHDLPNNQIKRAIVFFASRNGWDMSNYNTKKMKKLGEESYHDLSRIAMPVETKCKYLARDSLGLLAYAN